MTTTGSPGLTCPPRYSTPRNPERATLGPRVAKIAELLGTPLMPWQQHVADIALEVDEHGKLVYREVVITVPRQSGKTSLMLAMMVHRAIGLGRRQNILYTAQTRGAARKKWEDEHLAALERCKTLKNQFEPRKQLGQEAIRWKNGSLHGITSNTEKAGHGETLDLGVIDEAFAQEDSRLEQAFKPAMITRDDPQLWVVSTAGTTKSVYLRGKVDLGRARCESGVADSVAYFEWSAPEEADPADEDVWRACMPALGHTVTIDAVRADFEAMDRKEFRRAYLNQWPDAAPDEWLVIGRDAWMGLVDADSVPMDPVAFALDVSPSRTTASIAVAGHREDGRQHVEIIDTAPGTGWAVKRLVDLYAKWAPLAVVVDDAGPAGSLIPELDQAGVTITTPKSRQVAQACGALYDAVAEDKLRHRDDPDLNAALAAADTRKLGDAWAWARKHPSADISPLVAATLALWGLTREPDEDDAPTELEGSLMA